VTPLQAELARIDRYDVRKGGLAVFAQLAWQHVDPAPLRWSWHHTVICDRLERVTRGEIRKLLIVVPPGTTKTILCSIMWPCWRWIEDPSDKLISVSYGDIVLDAARAHRDLFTGGWFQSRWPGATIPYQNTRAASLFKTTARGFRFSTSVGGPMTGRHGGTLLGDDLNKAQDAMGTAAYSMSALDASWQTWATVMPTRQVDPATTARVLIAQRLHPKDVPGRWIDSDPSVEVLCLPMRYSATHPHCCPPTVGAPGDDDYRPGDDRQPGELLWPEHYPEDTVTALEEVLGPAHAASQLGQLPAPEGGAVFQRDPFQMYRKLPPHWTGQHMQSWDLAIGDAPGSSYVAGQVWARSGDDVWMVDQVRARMDFTASCEALVDLVLKHPESAREVVIEKKANGEAVASHLRSAYRDICKARGVLDPPALNIILVTPRGSKLARAQGVTGIVSAGHVHLPEQAPWLGEYLRELLLFTGRGAEDDDQVDATTQALTYLFGSQQRRWQDAMERARRHMQGRAA